MAINNFYNEILTEHNLYPECKCHMEHPTVEKDGVNPSCGDEIRLMLNTDGDRIEDGAFTGDGCAISQASTDIMLSMIKGKTRAQALHLADLFTRMIHSEASPQEIEELEEAGALSDIAHMPARVKCAMLPWRTLREALTEV